MRFGVMSAATAVAFFGIATAALAQGPWYVSGSFGGYFRSDHDGPDVFHHYPASGGAPQVATGTDTLKFNTGVIGDIAIGRWLTPHIRLEAEGGYITYRGSSVRPFTTNPSFSSLNGQAFWRQTGDRYLRYTGTVNAFYDFNPIGGRITPYVGIGVGASANHRSDGLYVNGRDQTFTSSGGSGTYGLALVEGGLSFAIAPHWSLAPAYRYIHFFESGEDAAHVAEVTLRYAF